jgi:hypothetical protein
MDSFTIQTVPADASVVISADLLDSGTESHVFNNGRSIKVVSGTTVAYYVSKDGYYSQSGTIIVDGDTSFKVTLVPQSHIKHRITIKATPDTANITLKSGVDPVNNNSSGVGLAYLDVEEGDFVIYKITAEGYMNISGSVVAYHADTKEFVLEESKGESASVRLKVLPRQSYLLDSFNIAYTGTTLTNVHIQEQYNAVWLAQSGNTDLTFTYTLNVQRYDENGNPKTKEIEDPNNPGHYIVVPDVYDTWVEKEKGALDPVTELTDTYGITYTGTPADGDMLIVHAPARNWRESIANAKLYYPRTTQITEQPKPIYDSETGTQTNTHNVRFVEGGKDLDFWTSQLDDNYYTFTRSQGVKTDKKTGEIIYTEKDIIDGETGEVIGTEIVPMTEETWIETTRGNFPDAEMETVYGLTFDGTPQVGDTFIVGQLLEKTIEQPVEEDGSIVISTDYFVNPDIEYWAWLEGYDNIQLRTAEEMQLMDMNEDVPLLEYEDEEVINNYSNGIQATHGKIIQVGRGLSANTEYLVEVKLHYIKNTMLLNASKGGYGLPGVYTLSPLYYPESYPSKYLHYDLIGGGGGAYMTYKQGMSRHHHGWHHHWESWHSLSGNTGGSGAHVKGYFKSPDGKALKDNIVVSVGYAGSNGGGNGSPTIFQSGKFEIISGGGYGNAGGGGITQITIPQEYLTDQILSADGYSVVWNNVMHNEFESKGSSGRKYSGHWNLVNGGPIVPGTSNANFGHGGGFDIHYHGWWSVTANYISALPGYAKLVINDNPDSFDV